MSKLRSSQINSRQESNENGDIKSKMILSSRGENQKKQNTAYCMLIRVNSMGKIKITCK
jgi:hypothetical protein